MKKPGKISEGILTFRFGMRLVAKTEVNNLSVVLLSSEAFKKMAACFLSGGLRKRKRGESRPSAGRKFF